MKRAIWLAAAAALLVKPAVAVPPVCPPGAYAGVDLLFLSPKLNSASVESTFYFDDTPPTADFEGDIDSPLDFAQRVFLGYQGAQGGGAQIRWFTFDNVLEYSGEWENGGPIVELFGPIKLDVDAIDVELTQRGSFRVWNWLGSAGVRYGRINLEEEDINFEEVPAAVFFGHTGFEFEGAGPTLAVGGSRPVLFDGLSLFANARTALLFGDTTLRSAFDDDAPFVIDNDFLQVWEFQIGTRCLRALTDGVDGFGGIFWEAQRWDGDSDFVVDLALHGFGVQLGLLF
jgi:hypothetical protein